MKDIDKAIEIMKTAYDCRKLNYWPRECDKCPHNEKCYTQNELRKSIDLALSALEWQKSLLTEPQPLALDELRERNGKPVFTKTIGVIGSGRWELFTFDDHWLYLKTAYEHYKMTIDELKNSYGKTWLAYDREPKGE